MDRNGSIRFEVRNIIEIYNKPLDCRLTKTAAPCYITIFNSNVYIYVNQKINNTICLLDFNYIRGTKKRLITTVIFTPHHWVHYQQNISVSPTDNPK